VLQPLRACLVSLERSLLVFWFGFLFAFAHRLFCCRCSQKNVEDLEQMGKRTVSGCGFKLGLFAFFWKHSAKQG
jgi:hypothetical protein